MVQLNTTYDSSLKQKIFVLKGDEGYARTTDVIAELITDFGDYTSHLDKCHVGLSIKVLRELGESNILVYIDDDVKSIPWKDEGMDEIINSDWNAQGIYWDDDNKRLIIGKYETTPEYIVTGLFLLYDVEHTIKVKYTGNKNCLGSHSKPIVFTVPTPDTFRTTLTLTGSNPPVYDRGADVSNLSLLLECGLSLQSSKSVKIYDGTTYLTTVTATQDTPLTVDLSSYALTEGLHTIKAVFDGDDECFGTETSLDISIGYVLTDVTYPSTLMTGDTGSITATIKDYFEEPVSGETIKISKYTSSTYTDLSSTTSSSSGEVSFSNVALTSDPWVFTYGNWHSEQYSTYIIEIDSISLSLDKSLTYSGDSKGRLTGYFYDGENQVTGIIPYHIHSKIPLTDDYDDDRVTTDNGVISFPITNEGFGECTLTLSIPSTEIESSITYIDCSTYWLASQNVQVGTAIVNGLTQSKQSNGWKFTGNGKVKFNWDVNHHCTVEFDIKSLSLPANSYFKVEGLQVSAYSDNNRYSKIKVVLNHSSTHGNAISIYGDNTVLGLSGDYSDPNHCEFELVSPNNSASIVIDNVKIYAR